MSEFWALDIPVFHICGNTMLFVTRCIPGQAGEVSCSQCGVTVLVNPWRRIDVVVPEPAFSARAEDADQA